MTAEEILAGLFEQTFGLAPEAVMPLAGAGSSRRYYRLTGRDSKGEGQSAIGTAGTDVAENRAFIALSRHFSYKGLRVPHILATSADGMHYLQTDLGDTSLFDAMSADRGRGEFGRRSEAMLEVGMKLLAQVQFRGGDGAPWELCFPQASMDSRMVRWDLSYFKYSFLKPVCAEIPEPALEDEFDRLHDSLMARAEGATTFMIRDFQSRNVMWHDSEPWLIDFQGGRRGPVEYDVASFLWQARARYTPQLRSRLVESYINVAAAESAAFDAEAFHKSLPRFVLFRMLQTLGAYGFRGLQQHRVQFIAPIPAALANLSEHLAATGLDREFPVIASLTAEAMKSATVREIAQVCSVKPFDGLTVTVTSFSYKKGIPADISGNGGGFVFDCRAIHNPGRYEPYKQLSGRDEAVKRFLEDDGEVFAFLDSVFSLTEASVARYLRRGFKSLCVNFGCTGGQHRSVYSAEATARHIAAQFPQARVVLIHREQNISEVIEPAITATPQ